MSLETYVVISIPSNLILKFQQHLTVTFITNSTNGKNIYAYLKQLIED